MRLKPQQKKLHTNSPQATNQLRIIGGQWRGRKLAFASADGLRPTGDRLRETLFNWLMTDLPGSRCLDLFSGSGALALEALSRGATFATLIELNPQACRQIEENLTMLGCHNAELIQGDANNWLQTPNLQPYNIVFLDPPFERHLWQQMIERLNHENLIADDGCIYIESPRNLILSVPEQWQLHKEKCAGDVCARLYRL